MLDISTFRELAGNRFRDRDYIGPQGLEGHYSVHVWIANRLFPEQLFASVAAATELFFCASGSSVGLPIRQSPCADKYFGRVLESVRPKVVFAMGRGVESYMAGRFPKNDRYRFASWGDASRALIVPVPHPNSWGEKLTKWTAAAEAARAYLLSGQASPGSSAGSQVSAPQPPRLDNFSRASVGYTKFEHERSHTEAREWLYVDQGNLVQRIDGSQVTGARRDWTGNDESAGNHNGVVPLSESPLRLRLSWKRGPDHQARFIGVFDLDLPGLLAAHHVRLEPSTPNAIRLRFFHGMDEVIYIQVSSKTPGLPIGRMP